MPSLLYDRVISQLDSLVVFMGLRERRFFAQVTDSWSEFSDLNNETMPPSSSEDYERIILQSALLLGVAYTEAYLADALREAMRAQPRILAERKKELSWKEIIGANNWESLVNLIIEKELLEFTHKSITEMFNYLKKRFKIQTPGGDELQLIREASMVRNLITHNASIANTQLAMLNPRFKNGKAIELSAALVHSYGIAGRSILWDLDGQFVDKFGLRTGDRL